MCFNPDRAPSEIKVIFASARRKVDLHDIFPKLAHKARVDKLFPQLLRHLLVMSWWIVR